MKRILLSLLLVLPVILSANGKKPLHKKLVLSSVYFSTEAPVNGIAPKVTEFVIKPEGNYIYVIIDNYPTALNIEKISVKIYNTVDGKLTRLDDLVYNINGTESYTWFKYTLYKAGNYNFDVYKMDGSLLGTGSCTVTMSGASSSTSVNTNSETYDRYVKSKVYFSTETPVLGIAKDVKNFVIKSGGGYVYVIVDNYPVTFNVNKLRLYMYKMVNGSYVKKDDATYTIKSSLYFTYFKYTFDEAGDYKFVVYDEMDRYVNTGYVTINYE